MVTKYFLGSNSKNGFISCFNEMFKENENSHIYILKGGAGCGKSNLMKKFADKFSASEDTELIYCCSDVSSLDAVIFPNKKMAIVDGTPPHTVEPKYPCLREEIVWLGEYIDRTRLIPHTEEIQTLMKKCKALHSEADSFLFVGGEFIREIDKLGKNLILEKKAITFINKTAKNLLIKKSPTDFNCKKRLFSAITNSGRVDFDETITTLCENIFIIEDKYYAFGNLFMDKILEFAKNYGSDIIISYSPYFPNTMINGIIFREEKIAFIVRNTERDFTTLEGKKINSSRFYNSDEIKLIKGRISFMRKSIRLCEEDATKMLVQAKDTHDELEQFYIDAMDYTELNRKSDFLLSSEAP